MWCFARFGTICTILKTWKTSGRSVTFHRDIYIKIELLPSLKVAFICLNESSLKMMRNAFYFMFKVLFVLKIYTFSPDFRSSRPEVFYKKCLLRNFAKFTIKHLCQSLFLVQVISGKFCKIFKKILLDRSPPVAASVTFWLCRKKVWWES